jgi:hypothetical protein
MVGVVVGLIQTAPAVMEVPAAVVIIANLEEQVPLVKGMMEEVLRGQTGLAVVAALVKPDLAAQGLLEEMVGMGQPLA